MPISNGKPSPSEKSDVKRDFADVYRHLGPIQLPGIGDALYGGDPGCSHEGEVYDAIGGGVKCVACRAWFCY